MGWFSSSSEAAKPAASDGEYQPPNRKDRKHCWEARDLYNSCLDKNEILDPVKDAATAQSKCAKETEAFERDCASSWVQYFKQKRVADFQKAEKFKQLEQEGAIPAGQAQKWKPW